MKKSTAFTGANLLRAFAVLVLLLAYSCTPKKNDLPKPVRGSSFLRVIHASQRAPNVNLLAQYYNIKAFIKNNLGFGTPFPDSTYLAIESADPIDEFGYTEFRLSATKATSPDSELVADPIVLQLNPFTRYSVYLYEDSGLQHLVGFRDSYNNRDSNAATFRLVNTSGVSQRATIDTVSTTSVLKGKASLFVPIRDSTYTVNVYDDISGGLIASQANVRLIRKKAYSFHVVAGTLYIVKLN